MQLNSAVAQKLAPAKSIGGGACCGAYRRDGGAELSENQLGGGWLTKSKALLPAVRLAPETWPNGASR